MNGTRLVPLLLVLAASCAMARSENRRTLNAMDEHLTPESPVARGLLVPLALPAGVAGVAVDALIVHPCAVVDDAWGDTVEALWRPRQESRFRRSVMIPLRALATPVVFTGDWLARALFVVPPRKDADEEGRS